MADVTGAPARNRLGAWGADDRRGFTLRVITIVGAVIGFAWVVSWFAPSGVMRYVAPGGGAAILALAFLRRPADALLSFALLILFYDSLARHVGGSFRQIDELALAPLALIAFARVATRGREWIWLPRDAAVAVVVVVGVVASLAAEVPIAIWVPGLLLTLKSIVFFYTVMWTRIRAWEVQGGFMIVVTVALTVLALSAVEFFGPAAFQETLGLPPYDRSRGGVPVVKSLFSHPVLFAWFSAFVALLAYAQFTVTRRWRWLAVGVLLSTGPFLAARRRAILALLAGLGAAFAESLRRTRNPRELVRMWSPVLLGLALVAAIFSSGLVGLVELTVERYLPDIGQPAPTEVPGPAEPVEGDENPQARVALYQGSVEVARDYFPLGGGFGRYGSWMSRVEYSPLYVEYGLSDVHGLRPSYPQFVTDTFWPQILGELGIFGLLAYVGFVGSVVFTLWREAGRAVTPFQRALCLGAGMVFAQALVESLASAMFNSPPRMYLLYLPVGIVASMAWRARAGAPPAHP